MRQITLVKALVQKDGEILLLRRAIGNPKYIGQYELPGGKVDPGEDPESALKRELVEETQLSAESLQIQKVASCLDEDGLNAQYIILVYRVRIHDTASLKLSEEHDSTRWATLSQAQHLNLNDLSKAVLNANSVSDFAPNTPRTNVEKNTTGKAERKVILFADGGSRGNPGPSALGYVIRDSEGKLLSEGGRYLGVTTNNQAEYHAVKAGLEKAVELQVHSIEVRLDSQLVVNQLSGAYQVKNRDLWPIHASILELSKFFRQISFVHIQRDLNNEADAIVNEALDRHKT